MLYLGSVYNYTIWSRKGLVTESETQMGDVPDFIKRHSTGDWSPRHECAGPASAPFEWGAVDMTQLGRVNV